MKPHRLLATLAGLVLACVTFVAGADVVNSKHNLSISGPGTVKSTTEDQVCLFCHTPHSASVATQLWNRRNPVTTYTPYSSTTARAGMAQPTGASLQCLSCHDGTIALGELLSRPAPIPMAGAVTTLPPGNSLIGTDLGDDHPVSIAYTAALASQRGNELVSPAGLTGRVRLDASGQLQCTSCHDAHDNSKGKFLVLDNTGSVICTTCHSKPGWPTGSHATSSKTWNGLGTNPWPGGGTGTVGANGCASCHRTHGAAGRSYLLSAPTEENVCQPCHNGNVATKNVQAEFTKVSRHTLSGTTGVHSPGESDVVGSMHVECTDCHNAHASRAGAGAPAGALTGVRGVNISGAGVAAVTADHEVCLRCHGDSTGRTPAPSVTRQIAQGNLRLKFQLSNASFHPVAGQGRSVNVPSLIAPWTTASTVSCGDCHNNNAGPGAGGVGPNGPHGSTFRPLLERQYVTADNTTYSVSNYAMCFKCHSSTSILGNASFREHNLHISGQRTPCSVCHDPHGVSSPGTATNNLALINFDVTVVRPATSGALRFESTGVNRGRCYLSCHGKNHDPLTY